jgi:hypothetical protein
MDPYGYASRSTLDGNRSDWFAPDALFSGGRRERRYRGSLLAPECISLHLRNRPACGGNRVAHTGR